jgi:hypothetical protein
MNFYTIPQYQDTRIIVAGCRSFSDYKLLSDKLDRYLQIHDYDMEIVSGTCKGADILGERYAQERKLCCKRFPADWNRFGKKAGPIRNRQMAEYATNLVAFWDGNKIRSGTYDMIRTATKLGLHVDVAQFTYTNQGYLF